MATIETTNQFTGLGETLLIAAGKAALTADQIVVAEVPVSGTASGEDLLSVLNNKLDEADLLDVRTNLLQASATTKWFVWRSDESRLYVKTYDGTTYGYTPAFSPGDYQSRLIYHTGSNPNPPSITWNAANQTFNITGGGWTLNDANAQWMRIVVLPAESDAASISPAIRVGDPPADAISYSRPNNTGLFPSAVGDVKEALDYVHDNVTTGGGGSTTPPPTPAADDSLIQTEEWTNPSGALNAVGNRVSRTFNLDQALRDFQTNYGGRIFAESIATVETQATAAGTPATIRLRFDLLDSSGNMLSPPITGEVQFRSSNVAVTRNIRVAGILPATTTGAQWRVSVLSNPVIPRDPQGNPIPPAFAGVTRVRLELRAVLNTDEVVVLEQDRGDNIGTDVNTQSDFNQEVDALPLELADTEDFQFPSSPNGIGDDGIWVTREVPLARLLTIRNARPLQTFIGRIRYNSSYIAGSRTDSGVDSVNFTHRVWSNLPDGLSNAQLTARGHVSSQTYTGATAQDATPTQRDVEITIPPDSTAITIGFMVDTNQFDADLLITDYDFDIEKGIDSSGFTASGRILDSNVRSFQSFAQAVYEHVAAAGASTAAQVTVAAAGFDGVLDTTDTNVQLVAQALDDLEADEVPVTATAFDGVLASTDTNLQLVAQKVDTIAASNIPVTAAGFDGVLDTTDTNLQLVAQAVDDLTSMEVPVNNAQFADPSNFVGGLREPLPSGLTVPGLVAAPANAQQAFVKADYLLQLAYNPYQLTQNLDHLPGGVLSEDFTVVAAGNVISSDIDVPELFRDISQDLIVRVRVHAQTEPSAFRGRLRIISSTNADTNIAGTSPVSINGNLPSQAQGQDIVAQQRIPAANVPSTFRIRLEGTATNTATATFNNGHVYIEVASGVGMAMTGGQTPAFTSVIIWQAGASLLDRLTTTGTQTLIAGNNFGDYNILQFEFDNGPQAGNLFPMWVTSDAFRASSSYGTQSYTDLVGYNVRPVTANDNQFVYVWGNQGLRRIVGINIG